MIKIYDQFVEIRVENNIDELLQPDNQLLQFVKNTPSFPLLTTHFTQFGDSENSKVCYHIQ